MKVDGITCHAVTVEPGKFAEVKEFYVRTFGLTPAIEMEGVAVFMMPNGSLLELYTPQTVPPFGYNDRLAFGFRVDDIEQASRDIEAAGGELLGEINRVQEMRYAYRHFRGPDGQVYGLNEQK